MKILKVGLIILMALALTDLLYAEGANISPAQKGIGKVTSTAAKEKGPGMKAERGVKNILFGWTDIPKSIIQVTRDTKNPIWGLTAGTFKGIGKAFPRTVSGIADVASFPIADYNKIPVKPDEWQTQVK